MITYRLRPDSTQVKLDSDTKTIINISNRDDQKMLGHMTNEEYYNRVAIDAVNWPELTEAAFNASKAEVLAVLNASA
jgi:hypothetical protein